MNRIRNFRQVLCALVITLGCAGALMAEPALKVHGIFRSNMVLQRDKPITIWGWASKGTEVKVSLGEHAASAEAEGEKGRWEVAFGAQEANAKPQTLTISAGGETVRLENILIGDVWVMNGQSNMAWGLEKTTQADIERAQAHLPLFRQVRISPAEAYGLQEDIPEEKIDGWNVCTPEAAGGFSAIGYAFGSRVQRALQVPVGIIDNARGGASIESLVPRHMFDEDPLAARYAEWVEKRRAEFDWDAALQKLVDKWENNVEKQREKGVADDKLPPKPTRGDIRSWSVPGWSPSDAGSCYNGMFGAFKGLGIKGVLFHQGYNNAMRSSCRPKRYRVLMRLMVEGWRGDFGDPALPVGVIGFCAGGIPQTKDNFEVWSVAPAAYIREAQRLGLADVKDQTNLAFLPAFDVQIPGLHPFKKREHGERAARWALKEIYGMEINWDATALVSVDKEGDVMVLTFDRPVMPDDMSTALEGFSIADESGMFFKAHATYPLKKDAGVWNTANKNFESTVVHVWSPLVKEPVAVRYAWGRSPMGNLMVDGKAWLPLHSFRTDDWDWPESDDPAAEGMSRGEGNELTKEAEGRLAFRRDEEAKRAVEILERLKTLGRGE